MKILMAYVEYANPDAFIREGGGLISREILLIGDHYLPIYLRSKLEIFPPMMVRVLQLFQLLSKETSY